MVLPFEPGSLGMKFKEAGPSFVVGRVDAGGRADVKGIKPNMVLVKVNGQRVGPTSSGLGGMGTLMELLKAPGDRELTFLDLSHRTAELIQAKRAAHADSTPSQPDIPRVAAWSEAAEAVWSSASSTGTGTPAKAAGAHHEEEEVNAAASQHYTM